MNSWNFIGRLTADPEVRFSAKGDPVLDFRMALDTGWGDRKKTLWIKCTGFGKRFEKLGEMLTKGAMVGVTGEITSDHWIGKDGNKVPQLEVTVTDVTLTQGRAAADGAPRQEKPQVTTPDDFDGDIPF